MIKRTPLYETHLKYNGKIVDFAGWELPIQYKGIKEEHLAVRENAGMFDVSHMGEIFVEGIESEKFVDYLVTNDVTSLVDTQVLYSPMCNEAGGIVDDLLVYRYNKEKYLLVVNAGNIDKDFDWIKSHATKFDVILRNESDAYGDIALQGPKAQEILQQLTSFDLKEIEFFYFAEEVMIGEYPCIVSRTGYTGEDGFEIYIKAEDTVALFEMIYEAGKEYNLELAALGARDTLRFEAGLPLYGNELSDTVSPLEASLGFFVKLDRNNFIGKDVLVKQKAEGLTRKLVGFELVGKGIARHEYEVCDKDGNIIGAVTTGYQLPGTKRSIGVALIDIKYTTLGTQIFVKLRNRLVEAKVAKKSFYNKKYKK
ncbi:MAG: glycine cleavage system aminomethyltransferase GcvT [Clostridiales bacterium]|nr:glycine cleavage system aminomethyltransferase GcvT [Clostridiales bacterium]